MPTSNYAGNLILDRILSLGALTPPATWYVALYTAAPTPSTGGTEVVGGSYARVALTNNLANFPAAAAKAKSNGIAATFVQATALWGSVVAVGLCDALTVGNIWIYAPLTVPRTVNNGDTPSFAIGQLLFNAI